MSSWANLYRPQTVEELHLVGVRQQLAALLKAKNFPQALLFAGPKGTGKASSARIIAVALNELSPTDAAAVFAGQSLVVRELDAASYRGIDDVRAIKEQVMMPPLVGEKLVYILDEAHMFTTEAFNALLKLLEEPPSHAIFILATTEVAKIPATIASRCTLVQFTQATADELQAALQRVIEAEKLELESGLIELITAHANGSFRDAVKLLESTFLQANSKKLAISDAEKVVGTSIENYLADLVMAVVGKDQVKLAQLFQEIRSQAIDPVFLQKQFLEYLHQQLLIGMGVNIGKLQVELPVARFLLKNLYHLSAAKSELVPLLGLEIELLDLIYRAQEKKGSSVAPPAAPAQPTQSSQPQPVKKTSRVSKAAIDEIVANWPNFVTKVTDSNPTLGSLLLSCQPAAVDDEGKISVGVWYDFHLKQLKISKNRQVLDTVAREIVGDSVQFDFLHQPKAVGVEQMSTADVTSALL